MSCFIVLKAGRKPDGFADVEGDYEAWIGAGLGRPVTVVDPAAGDPLLGICFGHQLLADALGGTVDWNPRGLEVGTVEVALTAAGRADPLFADASARFPAQVSHRQAVLRLPAGARLLAVSGRDPHQAFAVGAGAWGVQFHPEFSAAVSRRFVEHYHERLLGEGQPFAAVRDAVTATPVSAGILARFAALAEARCR